MEEYTNETFDTATESAEAVLETDTPTENQDETAPTKKKRQMPAGLKKISDYLNAHENLRQMVFFLLFSFVCFAIEYLTYTILSLCLKSVNSPINWFVFKYATEAGGLGAFIAFLISNIIAQICTFILNRKKTFNATNNVVVSGIMYAIIVILIIILNTYLGGVISDAIAKSSDNNPGMVTFGGYVGKFVGSFMSFVINFLGCKFLVMRDWGKKKKKADSTDAATETIEAVNDAATEPDSELLTQVAADIVEVPQNSEE